MADVEVVELHGRTLLDAASALLQSIWGTPPDRPLLEPNTLRAFELAGAQLLGAFDAGHAGDPAHLVGVSIAFVGVSGSTPHLHSHATGVDPRRQLRGVGFALKLAQRDWALAHGITEVRWTFDPLIARNAHFNLTKLGARGIAYHPNCYGAMRDGMNVGDETDRVEARWDLCKPVGRAEPDLDALRQRGAVVVLDVAPDGSPVAAPVPQAVHDVPLLARVPEDVVSLRTGRPDLARVWRIVARDAIGGALDAGFVATAATRDGWYVLERGDEATSR
jgi:predicted GNAT superfamily acetyltransferase